MRPAASLFISLLSLHISTAVALPTQDTPLDVLVDLEARDADTSNIFDALLPAMNLGWGESKGWSNGQCSLSTATLPSDASATTPLPKPTGTLVHIAIGRGTQNYTCKAATASATPAAIGALASLYDASCVQSRFSTLMSFLPALALQLPTPAAPNALMNMPLLGHHYFTDSTSPVFNLDTPAADKGYLNAAVQTKIPAPAGAMAGQDGTGNGAVAWLALTPKPGPQAAPGQQSFKMVYRVNTAGGNPPATCEGMPAAFQVQYAAEYWFYQ